jgi:hypothetical protein
MLALIEDATGKHDLRVIGKHRNDVLVKAFVHGLLERLMKPAQRFLFFEERSAE